MRRRFSVAFSLETFIYLVKSTETIPSKKRFADLLA